MPAWVSDLLAFVLQVLITDITSITSITDLQITKLDQRIECTDVVYPGDSCDEN